MIRVSQRQAESLFENAKPKPRSGQRRRRPKEEFPENILESQICGFLKLRGWFVIRQHVGLFVPFRVFRDPSKGVHPIRIGERGAADWMAIRPMAFHSRQVGVCELFFFEAKAPGETPKPEQEKWLENRRLLGFQAEWFDGLEHSSSSPFQQTDPHPFLKWYAGIFA